MKGELIYELFTGVGFCNQLFSLETAIYLANISDRKLILLIRNPLCHCGSSSWDFGNIMELFSKDYMQFLVHGIEIHHKVISSNINFIISNNDNIQKNMFPQKFSQLGLIDHTIFSNSNKNLADTHIQQFLHGRTPFIFNINDWKSKYIYINETNASRCFYNFMTTEKNYSLMSDICYSLTKLHDNFYEVCKILTLPKSYACFHFRFGDARYDKKHIDNLARDKYTNVKSLLKQYAHDKEIVIMCDRNDSNILSSLKADNYKFTLTEDIIKPLSPNNFKKYFPNIKDFRVVEFLIQKHICEQSDIFMGYHFSTVSNHIQYMNYINNKPCNLYVEKQTIFGENAHDWISNGIYGGAIGFKQFFRDNIKLKMNTQSTKLITLTNNGYLEMTENLLISMKKIGIEQMLKIYCIGSESYTYLKKKFPMNEIELVDTNNEKLTSWVEYRSLQHPDVEGKQLWASITSYKMYAINQELIKGNDVIFTDGDIVFERNPIPYIFDNIDDKLELLIQNDEQTLKTANMCTGFFWMRSNKNTIEITNFKTIVDNIQHFSNDQQYMRRFSNKINHKYLDLDLFPNGKYYRDNIPKAIIIHFNYDVSNQKIRRMKQFKKWYIEKVVACEDPIVDDNQICKYLRQNNVRLQQGYITQNKNHETELLTYLKKLCTFSKIRNVLEIGFLAGHSAEMFMKINSELKVTSIDVSLFQSVGVGKTYINAHYPNRHSLVKGDSVEVLDKLQNNNTRYDIILIDGSFDETIVRKDLLNCISMSTDETIIIMNNVTQNSVFSKSWTKGPTKIWNEFKKSMISEIIAKDIDVGRGFAIGKIEPKYISNIQKSNVQKQQNKGIIIRSTRNCGFFSCLLGIIYNAYKHTTDNIVPYIEWSNPKYMGNVNDNIFDYFFDQDTKPLDVSSVIIENGMRERDILEMAKKNKVTFREQMNHMFNTVCKLNSTTHDKIQSYVKNHNIHLKDGFHIRQTDRYNGGKGLIYAGPTVDTIIKYANVNNLDNFYVATDCNDTFTNMLSNFECISFATIRSSKNIGIHHSNIIKPENIKIATEAIIESYILAHCKSLYRVTSNFTIFSLIVNPIIPFHDLSSIFKEEIMSEYNLKEIHCEEFLQK